MSVTIEDIERAIHKLRKQRRQILQTRELVKDPKHIELCHLQMENNRYSLQRRLEMLRQLRERKLKKKAPRGG
jgi:hypothetical protein